MQLQITANRRLRSWVMVLGLTLVIVAALAAVLTAAILFTVGLWATLGLHLEGPWFARIWMVGSVGLVALALVCVLAGAFCHLWRFEGSYVGWQGRIVLKLKDIAQEFGEVPVWGVIYIAALSLFWPIIVVCFAGSLVVDSLNNLEVIPRLKQAIHTTFARLA